MKLLNIRDKDDQKLRKKAQIEQKGKITRSTMATLRGKQQLRLRIPYLIKIFSDAEGTKVCPSPMYTMCTFERDDQ